MEEQLVDSTQIPTDGGKIEINTWPEGRSDGRRGRKRQWEMLEVEESGEDGMTDSQGK